MISKSVDFCISRIFIVPLQALFHLDMSVQIEHLNKHIGRQHILHDISLSISEGEVVGLLGPNGAGKSTLMKILTGIWDSDRSSADTPTVVRVPEHIGYLPEQNPLYGEMYVSEYLQFMGGLTMRDASHKQIAEQVESLIAKVGLTPERHKRIASLSKGYRQRVGLAQAMLGDPELLILDEPTTGLDPNQLVEIRTLIRSLSHNHTVILSTHILQEVREMCDRVVILSHGQIRADKPIGEISDLEELFAQCTLQDA